LPDAGVAQLVERQLPKLNVAGSNPVARSKSFPIYLIFQIILGRKNLLPARAGFLTGGWYHP
jgi:hypothetical protein